MAIIEIMAQNIQVLLLTSESSDSVMAGDVTISISVSVAVSESTSNKWLWCTISSSITSSNMMRSTMMSNNSSTMMSNNSSSMMSNNSQVVSSNMVTRSSMTSVRSSVE